MLNLANIYKKYRSKLLTFVKGQVNIEEDAEDIVQNVFLHLTLQDKAQEVENVLAWLYKVAKNSIIDFRRKAKEVEIPQLKLQDEGGDFLVDFTEMLADDEDNIPRYIYALWFGKSFNKP